MMTRSLRQVDACGDEGWGEGEEDDLEFKAGVVPWIIMGYKTRSLA
jgi:hypothetical protein